MKDPPAELPAAGPDRVDREAVGRSRGGLSTKVHVLADSRCRVLARVLTAGQRGDTLGFDPLMARLRITRQGPGRPRTRPDRLLGDKAYSSRRIRTRLRRLRYPEVLGPQDTSVGAVVAEVGEDDVGLVDPVGEGCGQLAQARKAAVSCSRPGRTGEVQSGHPSGR